jgi:hypothetical protein
MRKRSVAKDGESARRRAYVLFHLVGGYVDDAVGVIEEPHVERGERFNVELDRLVVTHSRRGCCGRPCGYVPASPWGRLFRLVPGMQVSCYTELHSLHGDKR